MNKVQLIDSRKKWREVRAKIEGDFSPFQMGLVPTMGKLHHGHASLIETSVRENPITVVTIFVNPKQFGPGEDFDTYPRDLEADLQLCQKVLDRGSSSTQKKLYVFTPKLEDVYPATFSTTIHLGAQSKILCGKNRPGHFDGVGTVVYRLLTMVAPSTCYFGKKDYQQFFLIKQMVKDLELPVQIKGLPLIRDDDGLATSSRNIFLKNRRMALELSSTLKQVAKLIVMNPSGQEWKQLIHSTLSKNRNWDYLEVRCAEKLQAFEAASGTKEVMVFGALRVDGVRLIDNLSLNSSEGNSWKT